MLGTSSLLLAGTIQDLVHCKSVRTREDLPRDQFYRVRPSSVILLTSSTNNLVIIRISPVQIVTVR